MIDKKLKREAIKAGLCQEWQDKWSDKGLIEKYLQGISWCMKNDYPDIKYMRKMKKELLRNNIYIEEDLTINCDRDMYAFNSCNVDFTISGYDVCRVYIGRDTKLKVNVKDNAILYVDSYGGEVQVVKDNNAKCTVWKYKEGSMEY